MTQDTQLLSGNRMGRRNRSEPVRLGEILPEVMVEVRLRTYENAQYGRFSGPKQDC